MAFIENPTNDPVLRRGERLGRYGSMIPILSWAVMNLVLVIASPFAKLSPSKVAYVLLYLLFAVSGQVIVWMGMNKLRRCEGWDSGIVFYLWAGGFTTALVLVGTGIFPLAVLPLIAPIVATVAKRRMLRRKQVSNGVSA